MTAQRITTTRTFADVQRIVAAYPDLFEGALLAQLRLFQPQLDARMKAGVPVRTGPRQREFRRGSARPAGGLKSLLSTAVDEKGLRLSAGLLTKQARSDGFYGFILDAGRGQRRQRSRPRQRYLGTATSLVNYGANTRMLRNRYSKAYSRKISPISPGRYSITFGTVRIWAQQQGGPMLVKAYDAALLRAGWRNLTGGGL